MKRILLALTVALGACGSAEPTHWELEEMVEAYGEKEKDAALAVPAAADDSCHARDHARYIGEAASEIPVGALPSTARVVCHNCAVTQDYAPSRLNVILDEDGVVASLRCG